MTDILAPTSHPPSLIGQISRIAIAEYCRDRGDGYAPGKYILLSSLPRLRSKVPSKMILVGISMLSSQFFHFWAVDAYAAGENMTIICGTMALQMGDHTSNTTGNWPTWLPPPWHPTDFWLAERTSTSPSYSPRCEAVLVAHECYLPYVFGETARQEDHGRLVSEERKDQVNRRRHVARRNLETRAVVAHLRAAAEESGMVQAE